MSKTRHVDALDETLRIEREILDPTTSINSAREALSADSENPQLRFDYAWSLTKSHDNGEKEEGISFLHDLIDEGFNPADCLYCLSVAYYTLGNYSASRKYCERLLRTHPDYPKALDLHEALKEVVARDGPKGLGMLAGLAIGAGIIASILVRRRGNY